MSVTPTVTIAWAPPRPYAAQRSAVVGGLFGASFGSSWSCSDHMSTTHNPTVTTTESKRLGPGFFAGVPT